MALKRRVQGKLRGKGSRAGDENNIENLSRMINASRAFRNMPPEMTMGIRYDEGNRE